MSNPHLVITSISAPNQILKDWATSAAATGAKFIVIGDTKSPENFSLAGCDFYGVDAQRGLGLLFADKCPPRHYARKNIGYLLAMRNRASVIVETDDDNFPYDSFWQGRSLEQLVPCLESGGWTNVYGYFSDQHIWPRGFPLEGVQSTLPEFGQIAKRSIACPIQQGLADDNPDVDAIYRMIMPLPVRFRRDRRIALSAGSWCPFNSQNTAWWPQAYALLYLPAFCSFRMTDIWRSLIAQRIAWENGWAILFHEPTVSQIRNEHNLLRDFEDEIPGYLKNTNIAAVLEHTTLRGGVGNIGDDLRACYGALLQAEIFPKAEIDLLDAWLADFERESTR